MRLYSTISFLLMLPIGVWGAGDSSAYVHYDITNGLPSNNVYMCLQDKLGYMWFATEKGVVKYNGYEMKVFTTEDGLPDNDVWRIQEDSKGRIWINTSTNKFGYILNDKYVDLKLPLQGREAFPSMVMEANGLTYFVYGGEQMFILSDTGRRVIDLMGFCQKNNLLRPMISEAGKVYGISRDSGIYVYDVNKKEEDRVRRICSIDLDVMSNLKMFDHFVVRDNYLIVLFKRAANILIFNLHNGKKTELAFAGDGTGTPEFRYNYYQLGNNAVIVSNKNIYLLDTNGALASETPFNRAVLRSQLSYWYRDRQGNSWYATNSIGVFLKHANTANTPITDKGVLAGYKYVGMAGSQISFWWDENQQKLRSLNGNKGDIYKIASMGTLHHVSGWSKTEVCLSFSGGLYLLDLQSGGVRSVFTDYKKILASKINVYEINGRSNKIEVIQDSMRSKFLGGSRVTLRYDSVFLCVVASSVIGKILNKDSLLIRQVDSDRYNKILLDDLLKQIIVYSKNRVAVYDTRTDVYKKLDLDSYGDMLNIKTIQIDKFHNFYIQTDKAVYIYAPATMRWVIRSFNVDVSEAILKVNADTLFIAGQSGVSVRRIIGFDKFTPARYIFNAGSQFYNSCTNMVLSGEECILNTDKGYKTLYAKQLWNEGVIFSDSNPLFRLVLKDELLRQIVSKDTISIQPSATRVVFDAVNFYGKGKLRYEYRIRTIDSTWVQSDGEISMGDIQAGKYYTLELTIKDENWRSDPYVLYLYRKPHWYETTSWVVSFWAGGVLFFIGLVLITIYLTRRYVAKANEKRQQLTDLELRALHSQINPHFVFNTLSTALYFINRNEMEAAYEHVNKFSHLLRSYLKSSQERYIRLDEEIEMLKKYIELQQVRFSEKFDFTINVDNKVPANHIMIPSLLLQPLIENAINHGLFHKKEKGLLKIHFEQGNTNDVLICVIDDNGVGRAESQLIKATSEITRESYGNKLTQGLIDIFAQYEQMNIEIAYTDKIAPETGTIVKLTIRNIKYVAGN